MTREDGAWEFEIGKRRNQNLEGSLAFGSVTVCSGSKQTEDSQIGSVAKRWGWMHWHSQGGEHGC